MKGSRLNTTTIPQNPPTQNFNNTTGSVPRVPRANMSDATQMGCTGGAPNHDNEQTCRLSLVSVTEQNYSGGPISSDHSRFPDTVMSPRPPIEPVRRSSPSPRRQRRGRSHSRSRVPIGRRANAPSPQDRTRIKATNQSPAQALSQFTRPWDERDPTTAGNDRTPN